MVRTSLIAVALVAVLALVACGDDDGGSRDDRPAAAATAPDPERYCALTRRLDADGEKFFAGLGRDATPADYEAAERRFIEQSGTQLAELQRVAPAQIAADVRKLLAGMRQRAGLKPAIEVSEAQASAAEQRITAYEKRACGAS